MRKQGLWSDTEVLEVFGRGWLDLFHGQRDLEKEPQGGTLADFCHADRAKGPLPGDPTLHMPPPATTTTSSCPGVLQLWDRRLDQIWEGLLLILCLCLRLPFFSCTFHGIGS